VTLLLWAVELLRACLFACAPSQGNGVSSTSTTSHDHCPNAKLQSLVVTKASSNNNCHI
jgi:hypothetical protein